jgi:hypothetical protein
MGGSDKPSARAADSSGSGASPELVATATIVSLAFLMYVSDKRAFPGADAWKRAVAPYLNRGIDLSGLEYNKALAGKAIQQIPSPSQTALIYATGADRAPNGSSVLVGFVDGHVTSVDPAAVIWSPTLPPGVRGRSSVWLIAAIVAAGLALVGALVMGLQSASKRRKRSSRRVPFTRKP